MIGGAVQTREGRIRETHPLKPLLGAVAGTGRRLGRDVEPTSRLGSLDTSERNYWVAHLSRSEPRCPDWPVYSRRGH